jgi:ADP-ribose pyrophosphatase YjhB (NUDIX family)
MNSPFFKGRSYINIRRSRREMDAIIVRVNGVLIEDNKLLLVEQRVSKTRGWAHPGGRPEPGETLEECIIRETKEETGLDVSAEELLYVTDRINENEHVVIISFRLSRKGGILGTGDGPEFATGKIKSVKMVPISELRSLGFSEDYCNLVESGFPNKGSYRGNILD